MKLSSLIFFVFLACNLFGQPLSYTSGNVHSHNDYEQKKPFWLAYNAQFGSIEADIFLEKGELLVGHEEKDLVKHKTLQGLYLRNLQHCMQENAGHPFADRSLKLQILIDIKTDADATLDKLIDLLKSYTILTNSKSLTFIITGHRPDPSKWSGYPAFITFDGVLSQAYSTEALAKIALMSDDFKTYSTWNGSGIMPVSDKKLLQSAIEKAHGLQKPVRFWNAPDLINAWEQLMSLSVDYINTDHIQVISAFLKRLIRKNPASNSN